MKKLTTKEFIEKAKKVHGNIFDYSKTDYVNSHKKIKIICSKHGEFLQTPNNHLTKYGCLKCGFVKRGIANKKTSEEFLKQLKHIYKNKYDISKVIYNGDNKPVELICRIHGSFSLTPTNIIHGKQGCRSCNISKSRKATSWLNLLDVSKSNREKRIYIDDINYIIVDGYDPIKKIVYEFWGDYWHGNPKMFKKEQWNSHTKCSMGDLYKLTNEKRKSIKKKGYKLIEIWESDWDKTYD